MTRSCTSCAALVPADASFCRYCGATLDTAPQETPPTSITEDAIEDSSSPIKVESPETKTCPRCAEEVKFAARVCRYCGHDFPSPREGADVKGLTSSSVTPTPRCLSVARSITGRFSALSTRMALAIAALVVLALVVAVVANRDEPSPTQSTVSADDLPDPVPAPEQQCVDLWNDPSNTSVRELWAPLLTNGATVDYVSVGWAANYPDRCLITVSNPDRRTAMQFLEKGGTSDTDYPPGNYDRSSIDPNQLDPSLTGWNASMNPDGSIELYF